MTEESYANPTDAELRHLLTGASSIAVVGPSSKPDRPSNDLVSEEAAAVARAAGMIVVMDRCIGQTVLRLGIKRVALPSVIDPVDEAGVESFPASDPPAWAPPGSRQRRKL